MPHTPQAVEAAVITRVMQAEAPPWHQETMSVLPSGVVLTLISGRPDAERLFEQRMLSAEGFDGPEPDDDDPQEKDVVVIAFQRCEFQYCGKRIVRETAGKHRGVHKCSRCMLAYYCSETCQHADWKRHREVCLERSGRGVRIRAIMKRVCAAIVTNPGLLSGMRAAGGLSSHESGWVHFRIERRSVSKLGRTVDSVLAALAPTEPPFPTGTSVSHTTASHWQG